MTDYLASLGTLGFTFRTRRLADRIADAGRRFYEATDVPLEPNWHALLLYLDSQGQVSVTEAASVLRVSHPAIIEMQKASSTIFTAIPCDRSFSSSTTAKLFSAATIPPCVSPSTRPCAALPFPAWESCSSREECGGRCRAALCWR